MLNFFKNKPFEAHIAHLTGDILAIKIRKEGRFHFYYFPNEYYNPFCGEDENPNDSNHFYPLYIKYNEVERVYKELKEIKSYEEFYNRYLKQSDKKYEEDCERYKKWLIKKEKIEKMIK